MKDRPSLKHNVNIVCRTIPSVNLCRSGLSHQVWLIVLHSKLVTNQNKHDHSVFFKMLQLSSFNQIQLLLLKMHFLCIYCNYDHICMAKKINKNERISLIGQLYLHKQEILF